MRFERSGASVTFLYKLDAANDRQWETDKDAGNLGGWVRACCHSIAAQHLRELSTRSMQ
jgi:hypothetical protein